MGKRLDAVFSVMRDLDWHTLADLAAETGFPEASVSAQLRELRWPERGGCPFYSIQALKRSIL